MRFATVRIIGLARAKKKQPDAPALPPGLELTWRQSQFFVAGVVAGRWIAAGAGDGCVWPFEVGSGRHRLLERHESMHKQRKLIL